jgi:hypothetical protein
LKPDPKLVAQAIRRFVETQIRDKNPPETAATLERLIREGYTEDEAMEMIGHVAVSEVLELTRLGRPYDHERYVAALAALPRLPE